MINMWFDDPIEQEFRRLSDQFFYMDDIFENNWSGLRLQQPYFYGYSLVADQNDGSLVNEYGNAKKQIMTYKEPYIHDVFDEKNNTLKLVAEIPGVEKSDIKITVEGKTVQIQAERGDRKYKTQYRLKDKIDDSSTKAKYTNGVLELTFQLVKEKPRGRLVTVE